MIDGRTTRSGKTYIAMGSLDMAQDILLKARELARGATARPFSSSRPSTSESCTWPRGTRTAARATFEEALAMPASSRTPGQTAILYHDLGTAEKNLGDSAKALEYYGKALEINLASKLIDEAASDYYMIASVHSLDGRYDEAIKNATLALALDKQMENSPRIAKDLYALGLISTKKGDAAAAFDYFQRAYLVFTTLGFKADMKKALTGLIAAADTPGPHGGRRFVPQDPGGHGNPVKGGHAGIARRVGSRRRERSGSSWACSPGSAALGFLIAWPLWLFATARGRVYTVAVAGPRRSGDPGSGDPGNHPRAARPP